MTEGYNSFLGIGGCHAVITGAAGGVGSVAVQEFLGIGTSILIFEATNMLLGSQRLQSDGY